MDYRSRVSHTWRCCLSRPWSRAGTFARDSGSDHCRKCPEGQYQNNWRSQSCLPCYENSLAQTPLDASWFSVAILGATDIKNCSCKRGFFTLPERFKDCLERPRDGCCGGNTAGRAPASLTDRAAAPAQSCVRMARSALAALSGMARRGSPLPRPATSS